MYKKNRKKINFSINEINKLINCLSFYNELRNMSIDQIANKAFEICLLVIKKANYGILFSYHDNKIIFLNSKGHDLIKLQTLNLEKDKFLDFHNEIKYIKNINNKTIKKLTSDQKKIYNEAALPIKETLTFFLICFDNKTFGISLDIAKNSKNSFNKRDILKLNIIKKIIETFINFKLHDIKYNIRNDFIKFLIQNIEDIIILFDNNFKVLWVSENIYKQTGFKVDEIIGNDISNFLDEESYKKAIKDIEEIIKNYYTNPDYEIPILEYKFKYKNGQTYIGEVRSKIIKDEKNEIIHIICVLRNTTQKQKLIQKNIEEKKYLLLGKFANIINHDFNNYLGVLLSLNELSNEILLNIYENFINNKNSNYNLENDLKDLINNIKIEKDQILIIKQYINDLNVFNEKTIKSHESFIEFNEEFINVLNFFSFKKLFNFNIKNKIKNKKVILNIDKNFFNILITSIFYFFIKKENLLSLKKTSLEINVSEKYINKDYIKNSNFNLFQGNYINIQINSNFIKNLINEDFINIDLYATKIDNRREFFPGVFFLLNEINGEIKFNKENNQLEINIPIYKIYKKTEKANINLNKTSINLKTKFNNSDKENLNNKFKNLISQKNIKGILIVDDNKPLLKLIKSTLDKYNLKIFTSTKFYYAINIFNKNKNLIDIAILDILLEEKNGIELLESLKKIKSNLNTLLISGFTDDIEIYKFLNKNTKFLKKPFQKNELLNSLISFYQ